MFNSKNDMSKNISLKDKNQNIREKQINLLRKKEISKKRFNNIKKLTNQDFDFSHLRYTKMDAFLIKNIKTWVSLQTMPEMLNSYLNLILSNKIMEQHEGMIGIRKILTSGDYIIFQKILDNKIILNRIFDFAKNENQPHLQLESIWALANLSGGSTEQTSVLVKIDVINIFVVFCDNKFPEIAEQAIWGLGNISGDCIQYRNLILNSKAVEKLCAFYDNLKDDDIKKKIVWVFSNLCTNKCEKEDFSESIKQILLRLINSFLVYEDQETIHDALLGFSKYAKNEYIDLFTNEKFLLKLKSHYSLLCNFHDNSTAYLKAVNNILGGISGSEDQIANLLIKLDFLEEFDKMLGSSNNPIILQICWIISNLVIGPEEQVHQVLNKKGFIDKILSLIYSDSKEVSVEAIWVISNLTKSRSLDIIESLFNKNILEIFRDFMNLETEPKKLSLILEGIENLLKFFENLEGKNNTFIDLLIDKNVIDKMELLQKHKSNLIYKKLNDIMYNYFELE